MATSPLILALDTGSPLVSVALGRAGEVLAERSVAQERSSSTLLDLVSAVLGEVGARPADLGGVVALRGPGSFTGLRIGLSTALGLHQALGIPATALPTLQALAAYAADSAPRSQEGSTVLAIVDAMRGEWSAQLFTAEPFPRALGPEAIVPAGAIGGLGAGLIAGFGTGRLPEGGPPRLEAGPLAPAAIRLAAEPGMVWEPAFLVSPLYARPPAVTQPKARNPAPAGMGAPA
jgi:tRNA threonylcarbamoyl adenosine modification protein YeaZ